MMCEIIASAEKVCASGHREVAFTYTLQKSRHLEASVSDGEIDAVTETWSGISDDGKIAVILNGTFPRVDFSVIVHILETKISCLP